MSQASTIQKRVRYMRRKHHVRHGVHGYPDRPRMTVFRSAGHIYVQVIDDEKGHTLCAASTLDKLLRDDLKHGGNRTAAEKVGQLIARRALEAGVKKVVFDRNGFRFHGRVKALADAARAAGLEF